jgi:hypothetical protein
MIKSDRQTVMINLRHIMVMFKTDTKLESDLLLH